MEADLDYSDTEVSVKRKRGRPAKSENSAAKGQQSKKRKVEDRETDDDDELCEESNIRGKARKLPDSEWCFCGEGVYNRFWFCKTHKNLQGIMRYRSEKNGELQKFKDTMLVKNSAVSAVRWFQN